MRSSTVKLWTKVREERGAVVERAYHPYTGNALAAWRVTFPDGTVRRMTRKRDVEEALDELLHAADEDTGGGARCDPVKWVVVHVPLCQTIGRAARATYRRKWPVTSRGGSSPTRTRRTSAGT